MFVLYFVQGLGEIVREELAELSPAAEIRELAPRYLVADIALRDVPKIIRRIRTADDVRLMVAGPNFLRTVGSLERMCQEAEARVSGLGIDSAQRWSVTVSMRRYPWDRRGLQAIVARRWHGALVSGTKRGTVDLRLFQDGQRGHVSLNLLSRPFRKRGSTTTARLGGLRSSVAAALVRLGLAAVNQRRRSRSSVYDPCCGSGTVAAEAQRMGLRVFATDIDAQAVSATERTLASRSVPPAGVGYTGEVAPPSVFQHDLSAGMPTCVSANILIANLPWGRQSPLSHRTAFYRSVAKMTAAFVRRGGVAVFLTEHSSELVDRTRKLAPEVTADLCRLGFLGRAPEIVVFRPLHQSVD